MPSTHASPTKKGDSTIVRTSGLFIRKLCLLSIICLIALPISGQGKREGQSESRKASSPKVDGKKSAAGTEGGQWRVYGGDNANRKYSALSQINKDNVKDIKVAWSWDSPDVKLQQANRALTAFAVESTPLAVGSTLYVSTTLSQVAAINGATGETLWVFDPEAYKGGRPTNLGYVHRGVAYWTDGNEERILIGTAHAYLVAINAKTGKEIPGFGENGRVNLTTAIPNAQNARNYAVTSPPLIWRDIVVVGASISDGPTMKEMPRGDVQAFDVRTGKPVWIFHTIPQAGEYGNDSWENESWKYTGNANVWTMMSVDDELGYIYLPVSTPTNDWYGGHRLGNNLFAESLVCLDAKTGKRIWHFQTVHHGVWDYDLPAAPILCDITVGGRRIRAVAQLTKSGFCFVFDRVTGKPVWPIEEKPVPASKVEGERLSPTQPVPTRPVPFELQGSTEDNLVNFTPELRAEAKKILDQFDHGPLFTPPSEKGTVNLPGWGGGANWWGASFDPDTGMLYIPSIQGAIVVKLVKPDATRSNFNYVRGAGGNPAFPTGLPLFKPPYGRVTAINLNTGDHTWMTPNGDGPRKQVNDALKAATGKDIDVGALGAGGSGPLLTKTLLFIAQGAAGRGGSAGGGASWMRAFDKATGKIVAEIPLPAVPNSTPMTYSINGKQYIVVSTSDNKLVSLSLP